MNDDSGQPLYQQHNIDLTYQSSSDWSISNKSSPHPQQHCIGGNEDVYVQSSNAIPPQQQQQAAPFISYDTTSSFSDIVSSPSNIYQQSNNWPSNSNQFNHQELKETDRLNHAITSPDFLLHNIKKPSSSSSSSFNNNSNYLNLFSSASDIYQKPHNTQFNNTDVNKFHPRFKSANARLDPFSGPQHQQIYQQQQQQQQQFMSPPLLSNNLIDQGLFMEKSSSSTDLQVFDQDKKDTTSKNKNM